MRGAREGEDVVGADPCRERGECRVRHQAARRRIAADEPGRDPVRGGIGEVGEAAVPVAVLEEDRPRRLDLELGQRLGLGADVLCGPGRVEPPDLADGRVEVRIGHLGRVRGHLRDVGEAGSPADRAGPAWRAGSRRPAAPRGHPAPAVTDDLEVRDVEPRRSDPGGDIGRVVAEPVVPGPVAGPPVARQIRGDDMPAGRRERRPDPPPDPCRRGDAVDEDEGTAGRVAPGQRGERDAGGDRHRPLPRIDGLGRRREDGGHGARQI